MIVIEWLALGCAWLRVVGGGCVADKYLLSYLVWHRRGYCRFVAAGFSFGGIWFATGFVGHNRPRLYYWCSGCNGCVRFSIASAPPRRAAVLLPGLAGVVVRFNNGAGLLRLQRPVGGRDIWDFRSAKECKPGDRVVIGEVDKNGNAIAKENREE